MSDGQNDEDAIWQQQTFREYVPQPRVSYDGSDPDRGFTEDTPEPPISGGDDDYDHEGYHPPFCNYFHDSHMEVHREFWYVHFGVVLPYFVPLLKSQKIIRERNPAPTPETGFITAGFCLE